ncbi:hypothetical protein ACF1GW_13940 [Streptomyces achromogenes]|uniref:hypothetical protein n=1 Tax=Streptomyces achromogenes TaxID=67255 RepID=UPI0036F961FE
MPAELREHAGRHYAVRFHYALPDDAWAVELSEAVPASGVWAGNPDAETHLPGAAFMVAFVPDEDPDLEPTVHIHSHDEHVIPYEIMRWFMEQVADQAERCRTAFAQSRREAVESAMGGPSRAGGGLPAHKPDDAAARPAVRNPEAGC